MYLQYESRRSPDNFARIMQSYTRGEVLHTHAADIPTQTLLNACFLPLNHTFTDSLDLSANSLRDVCRELRDPKPM